MSIASRSLCIGVLLAAVLTSASSQAEGEPAQAKPREKGLEWVWANAEAGVELANLRRFDANLDTLTVGLTPSSGVGPAFGVGAGVRFVFVTLGVRGRVGALQSSGGAWQLWTLDAELGIRVPLKRVEPYLTLAAGYTSLGNFGYAVSGLGSGLDISGANLRLGAGVDFYITRAFSVGGNVSGEMLMLARRSVPLRDLAAAKQIGSIDDAKARVLEASGTSFGAALTFSAVAGLHF